MSLFDFCLSAQAIANLCVNETYNITKLFEAYQLAVPTDHILDATALIQFMHLDELVQVKEHTFATLSSLLVQCSLFETLHCIVIARQDTTWLAVFGLYGFDLGTPCYTLINPKRKNEQAFANLDNDVCARIDTPNATSYVVVIMTPKKQQQEQLDDERTVVSIKKVRPRKPQQPTGSAKKGKIDTSSEH